jgi:hypothetical protein
MCSALAAVLQAQGIDLIFSWPRGRSGEPVNIWEKRASGFGEFDARFDLPSYQNSADNGAQTRK